MEIKRFTLREMLSYAYCPMQWWLRYRLALPWYAPTYEVAFSSVMRSALVEFFRLHAAHVTSLKALERALSKLEAGTEQAKRVWPSTAVPIQKLHYEGVLAFSKLRQYFVNGRDTLIGAPIPYETAVDSTLIVEGSLDAVFMMHDRTAMRAVVAVTVVNTKDPHEDMVRWSHVRRGFAQFAIRKGLGSKYEVPVRLMNFPVVVRRPSVTAKQIYGRTFEVMAKAVSRGMEARYVVPTGMKARCKHCPYDSICNPLLATKDPGKVEDLQLEVHKAHLSNPFKEILK